jgi:hypothetical protein
MDGDTLGVTGKQEQQQQHNIGVKLLCTATEIYISTPQKSYSIAFKAVKYNWYIPALKCTSSPYFCMH